MLTKTWGNSINQWKNKPHTSLSVKNMNNQIFQINQSELNRECDAWSTLQCRICYHNVRKRRSARIVCVSYWLSDVFIYICRDAFYDYDISFNYQTVDSSHLWIWSCSYRNILVYLFLLWVYMDLLSEWVVAALQGLNCRRRSALY